MAIDTYYLLDGVALDDPDGRWFVDKSTQAPPIAGLRSSSIVAAGFDGELVAVGDPYDSAVMSMTVNVTDANPHGTPSYTALHNNLDAVKALFGSRHAIHTLGKWQGSQIRETDMRVSASTVPVELDARTIQIKYLLDLPLPLWRDRVGLNWEGVTTGSAYSEHSIFELEGATARCNIGYIRAEGPLSRLRLTDAATGLWLDVQRPVSAGEVLVINLNDLSAFVGATNVSGSVDCGPGGFYLTPVAGVVNLGIQREGGTGLVYGTHLKRSFL